MDSPVRITTLWMSRLESNLDEPAEAAILERAIAGDSAAFEQIVVRHERRVLLLAFRLLGTLEDAQDAAQEVFLRAFKYLHRCDPQKPIEGWLVRITVNVCRDLGRNRQRRQNVAVESIYDPTSRDPHSELAAEQQKRMLHRVLASLPEKERAAVVLRDIDGLSTAEVAEVLGSSEATVRSQISSARVKIKQAIVRLKGGRP